MLSRWFMRSPQHPPQQQRAGRPTDGNATGGTDEKADARSVESIDTIGEVFQKPNIKIHLLKSGDGAIVSVVPAANPNPEVVASGHVPVDIVLVIDVSGSMSDAAPAPGGAGDPSGTREDFGLSVLDLTKHAARTIVETLNDDDRLSIVTFSTRATVLQPLTPMTKSAKASTEQQIASMTPQATTNMWQGIMHGLDQFDDKNKDSGRVPALMVLTDGMPNFGDPPKGYVAKLREMAPLPATIHTFGFGYQLDACLLKSVAEVGGGNFSFIPDAGMIGTVFIHAVAHLQSTHATKCTLEIKTPLSIKMKTTHGSIINGTISDDDSVSATRTHNVLKLNLGSLQYGQSRDVYLECRSRTNSKWTVDQAVAAGKKADSNFDIKSAVLSATLAYSFMRSEVLEVDAEQSLATERAAKKTSQVDDEGLLRALEAYHKSRAMICEFLASFFQPNPFAGYTLAVDPRQLEAQQDRLKQLVSNLPARKILDNDAASQSIAAPDQALLQSLLDDLEGQITIAVSKKDYFQTWAMPYFASLSHAHSRQLCNSFKDPGPLKYNDNDFFRQCRDALDKAFEKIEPPAPSRNPRASVLAPRSPNGGGSTAPGPPPAYSPGHHSSSLSSPPSYGSSIMSGSRRLNMALYNDCNSTCFAGDTLVQLARGCGRRTQPGHDEGRGKIASASQIPISRLRSGVRVMTPLGPRRVRYVLRTAVQDAPMCRIRVGGGGGNGSSDDGGGSSAAGSAGVLVTPWHPICISTAPPTSSGSRAADLGELSSKGASTGWVFPAYLTPSPSSTPQDRHGEGEEEEEEGMNNDVVRYTGFVYTVMLQPDSNPAAHGILVSSSSSAPPARRRTTCCSALRNQDDDHTPEDVGNNDDGGTRRAPQIWGVTLGHGITGKSAVLGAGLTTTMSTTSNSEDDEDDAYDADELEKRDVREHAFFGSYSAVEKALLGLLVLERRSSCPAGSVPVTGLRSESDRYARRTALAKTRRGVVSCAGVMRDPRSGLVRGFQPL
ncbi:uncharacterized protein B0I36DRAFT_333308 [Microdochium trichocladiopsis]|uniref:VWFA domain-containing protein n=1 Tax=Microdochium trichocladiopsis TaxID=1682393 RepID=A0A9P8XVC7_9PEZI|nr:uncharacterized protein B0I36DRAFT_333308 [Microdochium trichocladiopsis]KAH7020855.1 hypothetical protein B0I36DRAFT_333308 [Microdochium trichocladiopsis]